MRAKSKGRENEVHTYQEMAMVRYRRRLCIYYWNVLFKVIFDSRISISCISVYVPDNPCCEGAISYCIY